MREDLSQKILQTIEKKHMKPKPKWRFLLKNWYQLPYLNIIRVNEKVNPSLMLS